MGRYRRICTPVGPNPAHLGSHRPSLPGVATEVGNNGRVRPTLTGDRPEVVAHRGSSHARPEHTASAYLQAIDEGADALECDVRLTADRHLVCLHDRRIDRTSTGEGVVSTMTLARLRDHDFGAWRELPGNDVLTLDELLDLVEAAPRRLGLAIETKHPQRYGGDVETALAATLRKRGLAEPGAPTTVRTMSFSVLAMRRMGDLVPRLPRVLLNELGLNPRVRAGGLPDRIQICGMSTALLRRDPGLVERQHRNRHPVQVYTVDEPEDLTRCLDLGVDAIITNRPAWVRAAVDQVR